MCSLYTDNEHLWASPGQNLAYAKGMSTRRQARRKLPEARGNTPKTRHYRVVVVGDLPSNLSDRMSALHAEAVKRQLWEYHRPGTSHQDTGKAQT